MMTPARLLPKRRQDAPTGVADGESGQPPAAMGQGSATAGGKAMNHGREEKTGGGENLFASSKQARATPPAPAHRAGLFLPNAEYMRFKSGSIAINHVYEKAVSLFSCASTSSAANQRLIKSGAGAEQNSIAPNSASKKTGVKLNPGTSRKSYQQNTPCCRVRSFVKPNMY